MYFNKEMSIGFLFFTNTYNNINFNNEKLQFYNLTVLFTGSSLVYTFLIF